VEKPEKGLEMAAACELGMMKPMPEMPTNSIATRQSLLARMKDWEDQKSWQDFYDTYWRLVYGVALQSGLRRTEAEEVVQETVLSVAKGIGKFKNDPAVGSFKSWLLLITRRRIADQFRKRPQLTEPYSSGGEETTRTSLVARMPDPASLDLDTLWEEQWEKNLLAVATQNVKHQASPKQFLLFYQQVVKEWPAGKVAEKYGVSLARVYVAKYRITGLIKKEVRRLRQTTPR
jgi:RNA polymerase sigma factor (sigma-70 family)